MRLLLQVCFHALVRFPLIFDSLGSCHFNFFKANRDIPDLHSWCHRHKQQPLVALANDSEISEKFNFPVV
jgi:hypothetical protein